MKIMINNLNYVKQFNYLNVIKPKLLLSIKRDHYSKKETPSKGIYSNDPQPDIFLQRKIP